MRIARVWSLCAGALIGTLSCALVQGPGWAQTQTPPVVTATAQSPLKAEQLDQLLAPIALYPDALLAQVLMASTYPFEIVQAARWAKSNASKSGKALEDALQAQTWDPSVKSLVAISRVLQMMDERLDWVQRLGDAFLAQREDVMNAVQRLRAKAAAAGKLQATKEQKVTTQSVASKTIIVIEPANPQTVYVPVYNPAIVYGAWPYPAYPPYPYYPPGYVAGTALAFTAGVAVGAAMWGNFNWRNNDVNINVNNYNSYNRTNISNSNWQHDAGHRKGVPYRDAGVAQQYGRGQANAASRDAFRGRTADLGNSGAARPANKPPGGSRPGGISTQPAARPEIGGRGGRDEIGGRGGRDSAFGNLDRGPTTRANADRGRESFASAGGGRDSPRQLGGGSPRGGGTPGARGGGGGRRR